MDSSSSSVSWVISDLSPTFPSEVSDDSSFPSFPSVISDLSPSFPSEVSGDSTSSEGIPLVDISSVLKAGKTNNSLPLTVIRVCSKINGWFSICPLISPWIVTLESATSLIVNIITIQLG